MSEDLEAAAPEPPPGTIDEQQLQLVANFVRQEIRQEIHEHWGDFPDADQLIKLEASSPGTISRVLDHMDREQQHRHAMHHRAGDFDDTRLEKEAELHARAQLMMGLISILAIGGGIALALTGHGGTGLVAILTALSALTLAFVWGRSGRGSAGTPAPAEPDADDAA